jgi:hypothetical protein
MTESKKNKSSIERTSEQIKKPFQFVMPESQSTSRFCNYSVVQNDREAFTLSFFEIPKPILLGTKEENQKNLDAMEAIPAICVGRIVMTPVHFRRFVEALQKNLEKYEESAESNPKTN